MQKTMPSKKFIGKHNIIVTLILLITATATSSCAVEPRQKRAYTKTEDTYSVCSFAYSFFDDIESYIAPQESSDIKHGRFNYTAKSDILPTGYLIYEHEGVIVTYTKTANNPEIWGVVITSSRIPRHLRDRSALLNHLAIDQNQLTLRDELYLGCDGIDLSIEFHDEKTVKIKAVMDEGII